MDAPDNLKDKVTPEPALRGSVDLLIWAIIALQILVAVFGLAVLPDVVPIHWGVNGQANGYGSKWIGTLLFPLLSIGIYVLIRVFIAASPRLGGRQSAAANLQIAKLVITGSLLFLLIVQLAAT